MIKQKCVLFFLTACISMSVMANKSVDVKLFKDLKKVSLKCHFELDDGTMKVIRHYNIPLRDKANFKANIISNGYKQGNKILLVSHIKECVKIGRRFVDIKAEDLDIKQSAEG